MLSKPRISWKGCWRKNREQERKSHRRIIIKDVRIFMNTINKAVDTMRLSGIDAFTDQKETEEYIECVVRIPKGDRFGQALGIETACDESSYRSMPYFQFIPQRGKAGGIIPPAFLLPLSSLFMGL